MRFGWLRKSKQDDEASRAESPQPAAPNEEPMSHFTLVVPAHNGIAPTSLSITAPKRQYVVKKLAEVGLADYEVETVATFLALAEATERGPIYDVGANIGVFALAAGLWFGARQIVAFEPTPDLANTCRQLAQSNELNIVVEQLALGAAVGHATLHLSASSDSSNSLREGFRKSTGTITVLVETLDEYVKRTGAVPSVLKVDTESTEPDVFRGGAATLREYRPWIICEVLAGRTEGDLESILVQEHGYTPYQLVGPDPQEPADRIEGDRTYTHLNWLFAPEPPTDAFWERRREWHTALSQSFKQ